jgi:RNA 2',3'-cyclic 3'-phosphodiesterase
MRLFVAVDLTPGDALGTLVGRRPPHFHATLRFFEDLPEGSIPSLMDALRETAQTTAPFDLEMKGIGAFPNPRQPRVVWVGFGAGHENLESLAQHLETGVRSRGLPPDDRPFHPHATVARVRNPREANEAQRMLDRGRGLSFGTERVGEIVLYESRFEASGAEHRRLAFARLGPPGGSPGAIRP